LTSSKKFELEAMTQSLPFLLRGEEWIVLGSGQCQRQRQWSAVCGLAVGASEAPWET